MGGIEGGEHAEAWAAVARLTHHWFLTSLFVALASIGRRHHGGAGLRHCRAEEVSKFRYDALIEPLACPPLPH